MGFYEDARELSVRVEHMQGCERVGHPLKGWRELGNGTMGEKQGPQFMGLP